MTPVDVAFMASTCGQKNLECTVDIRYKKEVFDFPVVLQHHKFKPVKFIITNQVYFLFEKKDKRLRSLFYINIIYLNLELL